MKKLYFLSIFIIGIAIFFTFCKKEEIISNNENTDQYYEFTSQSGETIKIDKSFGYNMDKMLKIVDYFDADIEEDKDKSTGYYLIDCGQTKTPYIITNGNTKCYTERNPRRNNIYESELCAQITTEGSADVCWYYKVKGDKNWYFMACETITTTYSEVCNSRDLDYLDKIRICVTKNSSVDRKLRFRIKSNCSN